ncbi:MAG: DNA polymerase III subunit gamma/tau [Patescibacteria group bacterium]|nr:DNA polymerase III subunit gamma/tau [Patescibacteria group bacterium]
MFYSKYRPQKFLDLVGLESLSKSILTALAADKLAHAYFFYGPRGTGKTSVARLLAKAVNCDALSKILSDMQPRLSQGTRDLHKGLRTNPNERSVDTREFLDVCGVCPSCKAIEQGKFLDLIEIDAASNRGIDDIRSLRDKVNLAPTHKKAKVYIIDEVHMLTTEAFNALLKTLEEPPKRVYFVLCTTDPQKVPETIKSRCAKFEFKRVSEADIVRKLELILKEEVAEQLQEGSDKITVADLKKIAKAAVGGFRDAETLLEQVLIGGASVDEIISGGGNLALDDFVDNLEKDVSASLSIIHKISSSGVDLTAWGLELLRYLRVLLLIEAGIPVSDLDVSEEKFEVMRAQAKSFTLSKLTLLIDVFSDAVTKIRDCAIPSLFLEVAVVKWFGENLQTESLHKHLPNGESPSDTASLRSRVSAREKQSDTAFEWDSLLKAVKPCNHSVEALLKSCRLLSFSGGVLEIEAFYSFHKERLETPKNRQIVEDTLKELLGVPIRLKCRLGKRFSESEDLSDKNISEPEKKEVAEVAKSVLEVFDGGVEI